MYRRLVINYCGTPKIEEYRAVMIRKSQVLINVTHTLYSIADDALSRCWIVASDFKRALGSIGIGKIIEKSFDINNLEIGSRVLLFPINRGAPIDIDGAAQEMYTADYDIVKLANMKIYTDVEILLIGSLSIDKNILDLLRGVRTLIVGKDPSILSFIYYASLYSSNISIIPKYTYAINNVKLSHESLFSRDKTFDVVVLAIHDQYVIDLVLNNFGVNSSIIILYPSIISTIGSSLRGLIKNITIVPMRFGDLRIGEEVYNNIKNNLKINIIDIEKFSTKSIGIPTILRLK